ncbi:MAG: 50S ribosomal protein L1 [Planctomycetes bacterium]|nr:50S ribosomal protein L1 [Planctomycetota bacterium]
MAKKQTAEKKSAEDSAAGAAPGAAPAPASDTKPSSETKDAKADKSDKKPRAPKAPKADKGSPAPPSSESPPAVAPVEAPKAPAAVSRPGEAKTKKKPGVPPTRGKKLRNQLKNARQKIAKEGPAPLKKAVSLLKSLRRAKFDETVEIHMWLGIDATQSDQLVRGTVALPHGIGKAVRVVVFCQGDNVGKAKDAGAEFAGSDDLIEKIQKQNWLDFDVALATQDMMGKVSRLGKVLGPRGLMPTPKAGTVVTGDVAAAVKEFKAGKVEYRTDKGGNVHAGVGKMSFDEDKLADNITAFIDAIRAAKPTGVKGNYVKSITVCATMSPGIPVVV